MKTCGVWWKVVSFRQKRKSWEKFKKFSWALFCLSSILISIDFAVFWPYFPQQRRFINSNESPRRGSGFWVDCFFVLLNLAGASLRTNHLEFSRFQTKLETLHNYGRFVHFLWVSYMEAFTADGMSVVVSVVQVVYWLQIEYIARILATFWEFL